MREIQRLPGAQAGAEDVVIDLALDLIGDQQSQDVGALGDLSDGADREAVFFGLAGRLIAKASDHDP